MSDVIDKRVCDAEKRNYPKSWMMRLAIRHLIDHEKWETDSPYPKPHPSYVCVYRLWLHACGPEEEGHWYYIGEPLKSLPLYSKRQALEKFIEMIYMYQVDTQPSLNKGIPISRIDIRYSDTVAHGFPKNDLPPTYSTNG